MSLGPLLLSLSVLTSLPPSGGWFHPNASEEIAWVTAGERGLLLGTVPVERTGWLLAHVDRPADLVAMPEVAEVTVLRGGHVVRLLPRPGPDGAIDEFALSRALRGRPGVRWAHPDFAFQLVPLHLPNDPFVGDQWHLRNTGQRGGTPGVDLKAEQAWLHTIGKGSLVAVIDTGVDSTHPDLVVTLGHNYLDNNENSNPDPKRNGYEHGTAVSGIIAAVGDNGIGVAGVAWGGGVYAIKLIGGSTTSGDMYGAFTEATDKGAWVLNNSWGYGDKCETIPMLGSNMDSVEYAETMGRGGLGAAVAFAAGNGNCDIAKNGLLAIPEVVTVAATGGDDLRESYSSFGAWVKVAAPSGNILTTDVVGDPGYGDWKGDKNYSGYFNGTSAATPMVSGVLALMFASNPRLTARDARRVLCQTASKNDIANGKYDATGWSPYYGCGRIDAGAAVAAVANSAPEAPVVTSPVAPGADVGDGGGSGDGGAGVGVAWSERVVLAWEPAVDADHDWLTYRVAWSIVDRGIHNVVDLPGTTTAIDLTKSAPPGVTVTFTVQAIDLWGPGPASAPITFVVEDHPSMAPPMPPLAKGGCGCRVGARPWAPAPWIALALTLLGAVRIARRRSR